MVLVLVFPLVIIALGFSGVPTIIFLVRDYQDLQGLGGAAHRLLRQDQICFAWQGQTLVPFCQDSVSCSTYQWCVIAAEGSSCCRGMLLSLMRVVSLLSDTQDTGEMP